MPDPEQFEIDQRPKARLLTANGMINVLDELEDVVAWIAGSSPSDLIRFSTYTMLGQPPHMRLDPHELHLERAAIAGVASYTKAAWEDYLSDMRAEGRAAVGHAGMPLTIPGPIR